MAQQSTMSAGSDPPVSQIVENEKANGERETHPAAPGNR
jgi:hypothetical protein